MPPTIRKIVIALLVIALAVGGCLLWRWLDDRAVEREWAQFVTEAKARGVKMTTEEFFVAPAISDGDNFAASPLWKRVFAEKENTVVPEFPKKPFSYGGGKASTKVDLKELRSLMAAAKWLAAEDASKSDAEAVLSGLRRYRPFFDEVRSTRERPHAWYPVEWSKGIAAQYPHFPAIMTLSKALIAKAHAEIELGRAPDAFESLKVVFRLSSSVQSGPSIISMMVTASIDFSFLAELQEGISRGIWTPEQLEQFQKLLASRNLIAHYQAVLSGERAITNSTLNDTASKVIGQLFISKSQAEQFGLPRWGQTGRARFWRENQIWLNKAFDEEIGTIDLEAETVNILAKRQFDAGELKRNRKFTYMLAVLMAPIVETIRERVVHMHASARMGMIACALERFKAAHSKYPENLEELVPKYLERLPIDPRGQKAAYRYLPRESGYTLYSLGKDQHDDGGQGDIFGPDKYDEQPDWVWPTQASNQRNAGVPAGN